VTAITALAAASFVFVFLKSFQQRSVVADNFLPIIPTSVAMASVELFTVATVARAGWQIGNVLAVGLGAGFGAIGAMLLYRRLFPKG
jgi:hypothetical protein